MNTYIGIFSEHPAVSTLIESCARISNRRESCGSGSVPFEPSRRHVQPSLPVEATTIGTAPSMLARQIHSKPYPPHTHDEKLSPLRHICAFHPPPSRPSTRRGDFAIGFVAVSVTHGVLTLEQLVVRPPLCILMRFGGWGQQQ